MNDARRKEIQQALTLIGEAKSILVVATTQEQDDYDNMPEDLRNDDLGERVEEAIDALERAARGDFSLRRGNTKLALASRTKCTTSHQPFWNRFARRLWRTSCLVERNLKDAGALGGERE